jgi:hypothetical protein
LTTINNTNNTNNNNSRTSVFGTTLADFRFKSTSSFPNRQDEFEEEDDNAVAENSTSTNNKTNTYAFDENGQAVGMTGINRRRPSSSPPPPRAEQTTDVVSFPIDALDGGIEYEPVLLNAKEHAVGYLSRILNARVYEAAIETDLQHAKNLSAVSRAKVVG